MPRHRLPEGERKRSVSVSITEKLIEEAKKHGNLSEVMEKALVMFLKNVVDK